MTAPGTITKDVESSVATTPSVDVATSLRCVLAERGPVGVAVNAPSLSGYEPIFGGQISYGYGYDAASQNEAGGGGVQYLSRLVGPAAKQAAAKLVDGTSTNTLEVLAANAKGPVDPGAWGNNVKAKITVPVEGKVRLEVFYNGTLVEDSESKTRAELLLWVNASAYVRLKDLGGADPKAQEVTLSGGTDDRASITITQWEAAQAAFPPELGPGQLSWPGQTTKAARVAMMEHAKANNRVVVPDAVDTRTKATHLSAKEELATVDATLLRCAFLPFGPWLSVATAQGVEKTLPPSLLVCPRIAAHDVETYDSTRKVNNPNDPAAGINGILDSALGLSQEAWTDTERSELKLAINVIRVVYGQVRIYGYRTCANPLTDPNHQFANNRRIDMALKAKGQVRAEEVVLGQVDSKGHKLGDLAGALKGVFEPYYQVGALYDLPGQPGSAYSIDVGEDVNPIEQLFEGKAVALAKARRAPLAEVVEIDYMVEGVS